VPVALDIGGSKLAAAWVEEGRVLERRQVPTPKEGPQAVVQRALELIRDWKGPLGIAASGRVVEGRVLALSSDLWPGWEEVPLAELFAQTWGDRVKVLNDAQAAAWGEYRYGGWGASLFYVTLSTGIGGGWVQEGQLRQGVHGLAGHFGHVQRDSQGPRCGCGRMGCLEVLASGSALERRAGLPPAKLLERAVQGEGWAQALLKEATFHVAEALADLQALLDPEQVVLGGSLGLNPLYQTWLYSALEALPPLYRPRIAPARLGSDSGLLGAADWVML
jgi:N-acylmannosamine kinase